MIATMKQAAPVFIIKISMPVQQMQPHDRRPLPHTLLAAQLLKCSQLTPIQRWGPLD